MSKKVLIVASHYRDRAPGQRFRFEQYLDYLAEKGFECHLSNIITPEDDRMLYRPGHYFKKFLFTRKAHQRRKADLRNIDQYDIVFIFREALLTRSMYFEKQFSASKAKVVFDFDDAIWLSNVSNANRWFKWLKNPGKTGHLIALADVVFAGNDYLKAYAAQFNSNIRIVPTTIDTDEYKRVALPPREPVCIGWSGSITTIQHFEFALPFLRQIKKRFGDRVSIKVIGDGNYRHEELGIKGIPWNKKDELKELSGIDIGIMPLPDDEWAKGKCGLKGLQYMALEIPTIMSPVGVNSEIIDDGRNGFLANRPEEWVDKITRLIESAEMRQQLGTAARQTVIDHYSVFAHRDRYVQFFKELLN
ncbi:MAG: glycosyltransferase family 4 protein [Salibacteraceae bacterium]